MIDWTSEAGRRADERLRTEHVAWLVTVGASGTPLPTPVWFWWDGINIWVYSQPDTAKLRHIAANPRVALAMRTDEFGDDIVVVTGDAAVDDPAPAADDVPDYVTKYAGLITRLGTDPAGFGASYSVPIRITPTRLRAWQAGR
ncbi:MAG: TIGR03667 family PPOX class F420-dependent oxidoreductase [Chloroflexi bacterium]|nr:TIGR03667 family PPOX class F420-dependent oxidoreductase [Chloroflexota bacterium]